LRLFSFGGYGLALAALALVVFGAYDSYPDIPFLVFHLPSLSGARQDPNVAVAKPDAAYSVAAAVYRQKVTGVRLGLTRLT